MIIDTGDERNLTISSPPVVLVSVNQILNIYTHTLVNNKSHFCVKYWERQELLILLIQIDYIIIIILDLFQTKKSHKIINRCSFLYYLNLTFPRFLQKLCISNKKKTF